MSTFTNFHTWATGETMTAALLNGITNSLVTAGNSIDRTNLTGGAGIDASQIKPSSGAAGTFGGSVAYTFPLSLVTTVGSNSVVPLTVQGNAGGGQTAHLLDVLLAPAGQNMLNVPAAGGISITNASGVSLTSQSSTGDFQIAPLINSLNTLARVAPGYNHSGTALGATLHIVIDTVAVTTVGNTLNGAQAGQVTTVTLSGASVFTSASSYVVMGSGLIVAGGVNSNTGIMFQSSQSSGTAFVASFCNISGATVGAGTYTFPYLAIGV